jgi:hypothetical protein
MTYDLDFDDLDCESISLSEQKCVVVDDAKKHRDAAKMHMEKFFSDKRLHTGGAVTKTFLFKEKRVLMVMNTTISDGVEKAYAAMYDMPKDCDSNIGSDVKLVISILGLLSRSGVPQEYAGGMLCVYLELVEGYFIEP